MVVVVLVVVLVEVLVEVVVEGGVFTYLAIKAVMVGYEANTSLVINLLVHPRRRELSGRCNYFQ